MSQPRLEITAGVRRLMEYPRFGETTRLLILDTSYFFDDSWQRAAHRLGWAVARVPSSMTAGLTREQIAQLFQTLLEFKPDFILTSNYAGMDAQGLFARFFEDLRLPYVSWFTDTPRMLLYNRVVHPSPFAVAASWERAYLPHFEELGFAHVLYMPLATDPDLFNGVPARHPDRELAFVGTSMIGLAEEAAEKHEHLPDIRTAFHEAFNAGRVTRAAFITGVDKIMGEGRYAALNGSEQRNLDLWMNYEATRRQRHALVKTLAPLGIEVRGDARWLDVHDRVDGQVGYFTDLAPYYRGTRVNLNATSLQMPTAVNQRVFDAPAAGGFVLTDDQDDLHTLFPKDAFVTYSDTEELLDKVQYYLRDDEARRAIIHRAAEHVNAEHTHQHRLRALDAALREWYA